ncbi:MAG: TonB-dependent receptor [Desulfobacterales bacterium]|nr:TonB-dependent receptor [Desulfobacterales bacterium]
MQIVRYKPVVFFVLIISQLLLSFPLNVNLLYGGNTGREGEEQRGARELPRFELGEVVVTATRIKEPIRNIPRNVTVITSEDIEQAPSNNVVDLLGRESGINLRSFFGNDKQAGVDIRGMGDTFVSNVIVMVDGVKLNPPDMAGPDLSSIPLDQIERIEIVRGAGSVLYGDGAVGGVINIITKKGQKEPETRLYASHGSYDMLDGRVSHRGQIKNLSFNLNADYYDSEGYRDNGYLRKKDAGGQFAYDLGDSITFRLAASHHEDRYGLPGRVKKDDIRSKKRRTSTNRPDDFGETTDRRYVGSIEIDLDKWGRVRAHRGYRFRDNSYIMGYNPLITKKDQTDSIDEDTKNFDLGYNMEYKIGGLEHQFQCGLDHYQAEYVREELSRIQRKNSKTESIGFFVTNDWSLTKDLTFHWGYRHNDYEGRFRTDQLKFFGNVKRWENGEPSTRKWSNNAYDAGTVYTLNPVTSFFASYATSFRIPNVDEFAQAEDELRHQEGTHVDIGGRHHFMEAVELAVTLFQVRIEDEIFFDEALQVNRNFTEKTIRRGVETEAKAYATDSLYLWGNYTYMEARFEKKETTVPLVPEHKATIGMEWHIGESFVLSLTGTYVGSKFDGSDQNNERFEKLDGYELFDAKVTYEYKGMKLFAGVNNIFDELYSTVAYSETYYPMPTRNFYGGIEWRL